MRRAALAVLLLASTTLAGPAATATTQVLTQHLAADARAMVVRSDPRYAGNAPVENLVPATVEVNTTGLTRRDGASARAFAATEETAPLTMSYPKGAVAEQRATDADNASPVEVGTPLGGAATAHARRVDLAAGICPPAGEDGSRVLAASSSSVAAVEPGAGLSLGAAASRSSVRLVPSRADGAGAELHAEATTSLASFTLLDAYRVRVVGEPRLSAVATGLPGGARIDYTAPVVEVTDLSSGAVVARLDATDASFDLTPNDASFHGFNHFANLRLGTPHSVIAAWDGTVARAEADVLELRLLDPGGSFEWQHIRLGSLAASVTAPAGGVTTCDGGAAPAVDRTLPRVLVYEATNGWEHTSVGQASRAFARLANDTEAFTVEFTTDHSFLRPDKLAALDAFYFNSTTGTFPWSAAQKALFESWLLCGGGTIGTHAASDANHGSAWPLWKELIGAAFRDHPHPGYVPVVGEATVVVEDQTSPMTAPWHGQPSFRWAEEYYAFTDDPRGTQDVHVLLSLEEESTYPSTEYGVSPFRGPYLPDQPLAWTKTFRGEGRVFYTAFGHNGFAWDSQAFLDHMAAGTAWVTAHRPDPSCLTA